MVRLVDEEMDIAARKGKGFQFHYGTIGRKNRVHTSDNPSMFQFHYGTIGRK